MSNDARTPGSDDGRDPLEEMLRQLFGGQGPDPDEVRRAMEGLGGPGGVPFDPSQLNPAMMQQAMAQFQAMMSSGSGSDGPVNWSLAKQAARQAVAGEDPAVGSFARREVDEALRLAELWLDGVTQTEPVGSVGVAWSRAEWVEATMDQWRRLTEPVAISMSRAMSAAIEQQLPGQLPEGMDASLLGGLQPMLKNMGGTMFGLQLGGAVGALGKEVLSGTDIGLPVAGHRLALVPVNIEEFGDGLSVPDDQIRIYLALREAARMRLFLHSPWLERDLYAAVEQYAAGIRLDTEGIERAELVEPWAAVTDAGHQAVLISPESGEVQLFEHLDKADTRPVDVTVGQASVGDYDALVLPGGVANPDALRMDEEAVAFIRDFVDSGKPVAAICHAAWTLVEADRVQGKRVASWPSLQTDIRNAGGEWVDEEVVVDGNLITSRNPDDIPAFNRALLDALG